MGRKKNKTNSTPSSSLNHAGSDLQRENIELLTNLPKMLVILSVAAILFLMPLWIDIELKHVFNTAKEILFGRLLMLGLLGWVLYIALKGKLLIPKARAFYFYFATMVFMILSISWSISPDLSIREISPQLGCFVLFTMIVTTIRSEKVVQWLITVSIWSALLVTLYGLAQYYDFDDKYFQIQGRTMVMDTFVGKIVVPRGESAMSQILPIASASFYQGILLPQKPEEHFKIYAFMGHRNYFSGYLVLILPLIIIRLMLKLNSLIFEDFKKKVSNVKISWDIVSSIFYSVCLVYMARSILLTQTRGALLGMVVSLCFMVLCSMLLSNRDKARFVVTSVFGGVGLVSLILGLMFVTGYKGLFAIAVAASVFCFLAFIGFFRHLVHPLVLAGIFIVLVFGCWSVIFAPAESDTIRSRRSTVERIVQTSDWKGSAHQRTLIYSTTLRIITDDFPTLLFGKGIGTFGIHYMIYQVRLFLDTEVSGKFLWDTNKSIYAHNEYIHWWSEIGLFGLSLMFLFWYFYVKRILAGMNRIHYESFKEDPLKVLTIIALLAGTIGTLTHCIVTFDLHLMYSMVTFYSWAAFALVMVGVQLKEVHLPMHSKVGLVVLGGIVAGYVTMRLADVYERDKQWRLAFYEFSRKNWNRSFELYQEALTHDSTLGELLFDFGRVLMDSNNNPRIKKADIDKYNVRTIKRNLNTHRMFERPHTVDDPSKLPANKELDDSNLTNNFIAVSSFLEATHNFTDPANFHNIALCFYKESQNPQWSNEQRQVLAKKSEDYYRRAIDLNPIYAQSLSNLGYLKALRQEYDEAFEMLTRAENLKDGKTPTTYLGLAVIYENRKEFIKALDMFLMLLSRNPGNLDTLVRVGAVSHRIRSELGKELVLKQLNTMYEEFQAFEKRYGLEFEEGDLQGYIALLIERFKVRKDNAHFLQYVKKQHNVTESEYYKDILKGKKVSVDEFIQTMGLWAEDYFFDAASKSTNKQQAAQLSRQGLQFKIPRLQELVRNNPQDQESFMELAFSFVRFGTLPTNIANKENYLQQGIVALKRLIQQNPNNVEVRIKLAQAYQEVNDMALLKQAYQNVLKIMSPTDPRRGMIQRKLLMLR